MNRHDSLVNVKVSQPAKLGNPLHYNGCRSDLHRERFE
jgi:hypothetical protein